MKSLILAASAAAVAAASPAVAATPVFFSGFENLPNGPAPNTFVIVNEADGWTGGPNGIELQNRVAGSPSIDPNGGDVFVELDTTANSSMSRVLTTGGTFDLSFLYSPRPGNPSASNPIVVTLSGSSLAYSAQASGTGLSDTFWVTLGTRFTAKAGDVLTFSAVGTSDSFGGYVDNISLSGVPEPATWALMILGFGAVGGAMRRRRSAGSLATA
jgi:hypothetical protein